MKSHPLTDRDFPLQRRQLFTLSCQSRLDLKLIIHFKQGLSDPIAHRKPAIVLFDWFNIGWKLGIAHSYCIMRRDRFFLALLKNPQA